MNKGAQLRNILAQSIKTATDKAIDEAGFDRTRAGRITKINSDGTCGVTVDGRTFSKVPVYGDTTGLILNQTAKVVYPCNQPSQMYVMVKQTVPEGVSVVNTSIEYYLSTSATEPVGGSWSTTPPTWVEGRYIWNRMIIIYSDGTTYTGAPWNATPPTESSKQWDEPDANTFSTDRKVEIRNTAGDIWPLKLYGANDTQLGVYITTDSIRFYGTNVGGFRFDKRMYPIGDGTLDFGLSGTRWRDGWFARNVYANDFFLNETSLTTTLSTKADLGPDGKVLPSQLPDTDSYWELQSDNTTLQTNYGLRVALSSRFDAGINVRNNSYFTLYGSTSADFGSIQAGSSNLFFRTGGGISSFAFGGTVIPNGDLIYNLGNPTNRWGSVNAQRLNANTLNINGTDIDFDALANQKQWDEPNSTTFSTANDVKVSGRLAAGAGGRLDYTNTTYQLSLGSNSTYYMNVGMDTNGQMRIYSGGTTSGGLYVNTHIIPNVNNALTLGTNSLRWGNIHVNNDIYLNGNSLSTTLGNKADLINGKVPNSQLPDDLVSGQWDEPDIDTLATDKHVQVNSNLIINNDRQGSQTIFSQSDSGFLVEGGSIIFDSDSVQLRPNTASPFTQLGRTDIPWGFGYITNIETYSNVSNSYFNVGQAIDQLKSGKADLVNGKVPLSQLPEWDNLYVKNDIIWDGESLKDKLNSISIDTWYNPDDYWTNTDKSVRINGGTLRVFKGVITNITLEPKDDVSSLISTTSIRLALGNTTVPNQNNQYDLGISDSRWKRGFFAGDVFVNGSSVGLGSRVDALESSIGDSYFTLDESNLKADYGINILNNLTIRESNSTGAALLVIERQNTRVNFESNQGDFSFNRRLAPDSINTYDIGSSTAKWRNGYFGGDVYTGDSALGVAARITQLEDYWTLSGSTLNSTRSVNITSTSGLTFTNGSNTLQITPGTSYSIINAGSRGIELRDTTYFGPYTNNATDLGMSNYRFKVGYFNGLSVNGEVAANSIAVPKIVTDEINGQTFMPLAAKSLWTGAWSTGTITVSGGIDNGSVLLIRINSANPDMIVTVKDGKIRGLSGYTTASLHYTIEIDWTITSAGVISSVVTGPISYIAHNSGGSHGTMNQTSLSVTGIYLLGIAL